MYIERAYIERETLSDHDLDRLRSALADEVQRYAHTIRNYPPDRMKNHGQPFLDRLQNKVAIVDELIRQRAAESEAGAGA